MRIESVKPPDTPSLPSLLRRAAPLLAAAALAGGCAPFLSSYGLRVGTTLFMFVALAQAWNLIGGYAGMLALAHPAFFGGGAIAFAVMLINAVPVPVAGALATVISVALALLVGYPTLRLRGHYFVIATLLAAEAVRNLVLNFDAFGFRGGIAVNIIGATGLKELSAAQYNMTFFYCMLAVAFAAVMTAAVIDASRWGYGLRALRDNRDAAGALGVPATPLLLTIFTVSAILTSITGSVWAAWLGIVEANEAFGLKLTFEIVVMVFLGGKGTVWGPIVGAAVVLFLDEVIGVEFAEFTLLTSGLIVVLVILFLPDGLISLFRRGADALSLRTLRSNLTRYRIQ